MTYEKATPRQSPPQCDSHARDSKNDRKMMRALVVQVVTTALHNAMQTSIKDWMNGITAKKISDEKNLSAW